MLYQIVEWIVYRILGQNISIIYITLMLYSDLNIDVGFLYI